jgi:hypothetical protein
MNNQVSTFADRALDAEVLRKAMRGESMPNPAFQHETPDQVEYEMTKSGSGFMDKVKSFLPSFGNSSSSSGSTFGKMLGRLLNTKTASVMAQESLPTLGDYITRKSDPNIERGEEYARRRAAEEDELRDIKREIDRVRTMREYEKTYDSSSQQRDEEFEKLRREVAEAKLKAEVNKLHTDPNALRITHSGKSIALADMTDAQLDALNTAHQLTKEIKGDGVIANAVGSFLKPAIRISLNELVSDFKKLPDSEKDKMRKELFGEKQGGGILGDIFGSIF